MELKDFSVLFCFTRFIVPIFFVSYIPLFEIWHRNHMPAKPNVGAKIQTAVTEKEIGTIIRKTTTSILNVGILNISPFQISSCSWTTLRWR